MANIQNSNIVATTTPSPALVAKDLKTQVNVIQDVMKSVMKEGEHFGSIPGCGSKKTLLKSGAEKILMAFRLGAEPSVQTDERADSVSYRVTVRIFNISDGNTVGYGIGECSSLEEKYAWRATYVDAEWQHTPPELKRMKYTQKGETRQIRTNFKDVSNTVLKMAKKRALIDAVLTATAASDIFTQDLEDWSPEMIATLAEDAPKQQTPALTPIKAKAPKPPIAPAITNASINNVASALKQLGLEAEVKEGFVAARGATYGKETSLKGLGFRFNRTKSVWYRKAA
jgi:hypothetical protein